MTFELTLAVVLIGSAVIATAVLGMRLPAGDRISAVLALVVGAGVGVIALAIGTFVSDPPDDAAETVERIFLVASALGFVATLGSLALLWRWTERARSSATS